MAQNPGHGPDSASLSGSAATLKFGGLLDIVLTVLAWLYLAAGKPVPTKIKDRIKQ